MSGPRVGDYVIVRITEIIPYGAFCELVEYPEYRGFIHISEVSTSWVKNIRQHVKEGQLRVAKVLRVSHDKRMCDLSLKRVSGSIEKRKLEEARRKKRGENLLKVAAKEAGGDPSEVKEKLEQAFGDVLHAFELAALEGASALADVDIPERWKQAILKVAQKYIEIPRKTVRAEIEMKVPGPRGVEIIKEALLEAKKRAEEHPHVSVNMYTAGAPRYVVELTSYDYKSAERLLSELCEDVVKRIKKAGGEADWRRVEE